MERFFKENIFNYQSYSLRSMVGYVISIKTQYINFYQPFKKGEIYRFTTEYFSSLKNNRLSEHR